MIRNMACVEDSGYRGAEINGKNNLTLLGVWGADNTTIDGRDGGGDTLYVHGFDTDPTDSIERFTVEGGYIHNLNPENLEME